MKFLTTHTVPGQSIEPIGLLVDSETLGMHIGRDWLVWIRDLIGGRSYSVDKLVKQALDTVLKRLAQRASMVEADICLGTRIHIQPISTRRGTLMHVAVYTTAARMHPPQPSTNIPPVSPQFQS